VEGGVLWRNGCDGKFLRCGAGERYQHFILIYSTCIIPSTAPLCAVSCKYSACRHV
jgi:hypothetical protein